MAHPYAHRPVRQSHAQPEPSTCHCLQEIVIDPRGDLDFYYATAQSVFQHFQSILSPPPHPHATFADHAHDLITSFRVRSNIILSWPIWRGRTGRENRLRAGELQFLFADDVSDAQVAAVTAALLVMHGRQELLPACPEADVMRRFMEIIRAFQPRMREGLAQVRSWYDRLGRDTDIYPSYGSERALLELHERARVSWELNDMEKYNERVVKVAANTDLRILNLVGSDEGIRGQANVKATRLLQLEHILGPLRADAARLLASTRGGGQVLCPNGSRVCDDMTMQGLVDHFGPVWRHPHPHETEISDSPNQLRMAMRRCRMSLESGVGCPGCPCASRGHPCPGGAAGAGARVYPRGPGPHSHPCTVLREAMGEDAASVERLNFAVTYEQLQRFRTRRRHQTWENMRAAQKRGDLTAHQRAQAIGGIERLCVSWARMREAAAAAREHEHDDDDQSASENLSSSRSSPPSSMSSSRSYGRRKPQQAGGAVDRGPPEIDRRPHVTRRLMN